MPADDYRRETAPAPVTVKPRWRGAIAIATILLGGAALTAAMMGRHPTSATAGARVVATVPPGYTIARTCRDYRAAIASYDAAGRTTAAVLPLRVLGRRLSALAVQLSARQISDPSVVLASDLGVAGARAQVLAMVISKGRQPAAGPSVSLLSNESMLALSAVSAYCSRKGA